MMNGMEDRKDVYFGTSLDNVLYQLKNRSNLRVCGIVGWWIYGGGNAGVNDR